MYNQFFFCTTVIKINFYLSRIQCNLRKLFFFFMKIKFFYFDKNNSKILLSKFLFLITVLRFLPSEHTL